MPKYTIDISSELLILPVEEHIGTMWDIDSQSGGVSSDYIIHELSFTLVNTTTQTDRGDKKTDLYTMKLATLHHKMDQGLEVIDTYVATIQSQIIDILWIYYPEITPDLPMIQLIQDKRDKLALLIDQFKINHSSIQSWTHWKKVWIYHDKVLKEIYHCIKDLEEYF
jgi:hypothetical protein